MLHMCVHMLCMCPIKNFVEKYIPDDAGSDIVDTRQSNVNVLLPLFSINQNSSIMTGFQLFNSFYYPFIENKTLNNYLSFLSISTISKLTIDADLLSQFKKGYSEDILVNKIYTHLFNEKYDKFYVCKDDYKSIYHQKREFLLNDDDLLVLKTHPNRIYVPKLVRNEILSSLHDSLIAGHIGTNKMILNASNQFYWHKMAKDIENWCKSCVSCQKAKPTRLGENGLLHPLEIPTFRFESISMDFLTKLPLTKGNQDAILVIVDRLTKMAFFLPINENATAKDVANVYFHYIFPHFGLPKNIVSDRDPKFTSSFWQNLLKICEVEKKMSTADHPQTDGQTERMIQLLEEPLRIFVNHKQNNWDEFLPYFQFAYNNSVSSTTKLTPFQAFANFNLLTPLKLRLRSSNLSSTENIESIEFAEDIQANIVRAIDNIRIAQERQVKYANEKRKHIIFQIGEKVLVKNEFLNPSTFRDQKNHALKNKYVGPYKILEKITDLAYRIELPNDSRKHNVVPISKLRSFESPNKNFTGRIEPVPDPVIVDNEKEWKVRSIENERISHGKLQFLVRWEGFHGENDEYTWEPLNFVEDLEALDIYLLSNPNSNYFTHKPKTPIPIPNSNSKSDSIANSKKKNDSSITNNDLTNSDMIKPVPTAANSSRKLRNTAAREKRAGESASKEKDMTVRGTNEVRKKVSLLSPISDFPVQRTVVSNHGKNPKEFR